jgi:hypothetical protein
MVGLKLIEAELKAAKRENLKICQYYLDKEELFAKSHEDLIKKYFRA